MALPATWSARSYAPRHSAWPYHPRDFVRADESADTAFYSAPRLVTHIDDDAIARLTAYYAATLPRRGRILDFCSSWISHYPDAVTDAVEKGELEVLGAGLNAAELDANAALARRQGRRSGRGRVRWPLARDLNAQPDLAEALDEAADVLDAATCAVSIDYLTRPREVLGSIRRRMRKGGVVHLVVSNRCFPTKVVSRWLRVGEEERLEMVADYLAFSGWSKIEIVESERETSFLGFGSDPLWVVRGVNEG